MKVVHVVLSLKVGGLERVVLELARAERASGRPATLICLERRGSLASVLESAGDEVICLDKPPGRRPEVVGRLVAVFERIRPDVVHTHQIGALYYAGRAARRAGVGAVVHTEHGNHIARCRTFREKFKAQLIRAIAGRHAGRFFCVSDEIARAVTRSRLVDRRKVSVVPNGVDTKSALGLGASARVEASESLGLPAAGPVIGTMGRLSEVKRQDVLIRGFARLLDRHPDARLVLIGDGPERPALESLATELGLVDRIRFAGYRADPERLLPALDVFALTSRSEGMPLAILEAWASGLPVVASRVGGIPALIDHDRDGLLFDSGNEVELAGLLSGLLDDPNRARRLGEAGRVKAVEKFDSSVMASAYDRHYREVLATTRTRSRG